MGSVTLFDKFIPAILLSNVLKAVDGSAERPLVKAGVIECTMVY